jgi:ubiquinone/menaquinone biosynthesis C-methylase UbiE
MIPNSPDSRERFTNRVRDYVRFRPSYPQEIISLLRRHVSPGATIADIGSGTGIFSRLLLESGFVVHAVEPNPAMRRAAESTLGGFTGFISVGGEGERTTLDDQAVHAITVAQAFHWFATKRAVTEFSRILMPGGTVFLVWNDRETDCDAFHREYEDLLLRYGTDYKKVNHRNVTEKVVRDLFEGWTCEVSRMENYQDLDLEGLLGRLQSSSYCPPEGHPLYTSLISAMRTLFNRESVGGVVRMKYSCTTFVLRSDQEKT